MIELKEVSGKVYKVSNGTYYNEKTPNEVIRCLESINRNERVRVFYGDAETGSDWMEENNMMGYVGRSTGQVKIPLLVPNSRSYGGGGILDHCIVKLSVNKKVVYQHPTYNIKQIEIMPTDAELKEKGYTHGAFVNSENVANFKNENAALRYKEFISGYSNRH